MSRYPPERLSDFVQGLFLNGQADTAGWHSKLQLFLYALLDRQGGMAGQKIGLASFRYAPGQLHDMYHCSVPVGSAVRLLSTCEHYRVYTCMQSDYGRSIL